MFKKIIVGSLLLGMFLYVGYAERHNVEKNCKVIEATDTGCIIEDSHGDTWYWEGEGFNVGDIVDMTINDNTTINNVDDDYPTKVVIK